MKPTPRSDGRVQGSKVRDVAGQRRNWGHSGTTIKRGTGMKADRRTGSNTGTPVIGTENYCETM